MNRKEIKSKKIQEINMILKKQSINNNILLLLELLML